MPKRTSSKKNRMTITTIILIIAVAAMVLGIWRSIDRKKPLKTISGKARLPIQSQHVIDYNNMEKDRMIKDLMTERKQEHGIGDSIDIIAKADESVKVGNTTVPMQEIMEKIQLKIGDIVEKDIQSQQGAIRPAIKEFGIYVVQRNDNIWNIHFKLLKDYFDRKGILLSPLSDEPKVGGYSSGVGKILKFSENIVYIYNIETHNLDINLNMIQPLSKLVVYNMDRIFSLLEQIDYKKVDRIEFDGETLWLPAEE